MNVVEILKKHDVSKIQFAKDFFLSRPTLDDYIERFENGEKLPKEKYQLIFTSLFKGDSNANFEMSYNHYKKLIRRDRAIKLDDLSPEITNKLFHIIGAIKRSLSSDGSSDLLEFVSYVSEEYMAQTELVNLWVIYFNELNNLSEHKGLTKEQKNYLGAFYLLNRSFIEGTLVPDESGYAKFIERKKRLKAINEEMKQEIHEKIHKKIEAMISKRVEEELKAMPSDATSDEIVDKIMDDIR